MSGVYGTSAQLSMEELKIYIEKQNIYMYIIMYGGAEYLQGYGETRRIF